METRFSSVDHLRLLDSEDACIRHLYRTKWPEGFTCPLCRHREASVIRTRRLPLYQCRKCRYQVSLTAGTVMEKSKTPLRKWFLAIYWVAFGASARHISDSIQVTYKTAWLIAHKIRRAISLAESEVKLAGNVRVNEARYEPTSFTALFDQSRKKHPLIAAASISENGRIVLVKLHQVLPGDLFAGMITRDGFQSFIRHHVKPESAVQLAIGIYNSARHRPLARLCQEASRWMNETFRGLGPKHLQAYLNQFEYRFRFESEDGASILTDLLHQCSFRPVVTYSQLIGRSASPNKYSFSVDCMARSS
ncbi:hypothetical protein J19TS2_35330 [Cohnella xylanilytica]|uniref:IS1595 family transposase n=1 Tax=Cohnella xylanilytica TaxID=557555 RepID=A0A841U9F8_9BACL|nr:transposase [Cohnella xylanilytica]MBB6694734.1 IS1595 family transposase [Cohnella xylanilytica]GIO13978.1 hypothetical protein J19TS2_35330 [Cohnella xylanilytica]